MKRYGIRQHVTLLTLIPLLIIVIGLESFFLYSRFSELDQDLLKRGELIADQLVASGEYGVFSNNQAFLQNAANGALQQPDVRGLIFLNSASEILISAGKFSRPPNDAFPEADMKTGRQMIEDAIILQPRIRDDEQSFWIYHPIIPAQIALDSTDVNPAVHPVGAIVMEMSKLRTGEIKAQMFRVTAIATALFLVFSFYLLHLASRSIAYPIRRLSEAVQAIGAGKLDTRVTLPTRVNELAILAQGMNEMAAQLHGDRTVLQQRIDEATQALRAKKDEAERASHDKSRFLAVASHDLRQPLHALGLYVAELQRKVTDSGQQHLVGQVAHSTEALSTLLNALLDISKLDAGAVVPQMQTCDVNAMLEHVAADYRMLAGIKNIRLVIRPFSGSIISDPLLMERVLTNLVSNAIRYTRPNGCVMIACRRRGRLLRIEVRDNGVGISKIDQANIFREFFQLTQPQLDANKGLGLGLAIVDRLVKLLGHRIELRSTPGKGSVFALETPIAPRHGRVPAATIQSPPDHDHVSGKSPLAGKKLLVVDDDALVLSGTA
ncbi:MAG: HAMP domain-containing protein, partial [Gallionella sp.]